MWEVYARQGGRAEVFIAVYSFVLLLVPRRVRCSVLRLLILLATLVEHLLEELELSKCRKDEEQERGEEEG